MFENCLFNNFKGKNTLFCLKILLANYSFLTFPNKNSRNLSFLAIITQVVCRRAILCAPTVAYILGNYSFQNPVFCNCIISNYCTDEHVIVRTHESTSETRSRIHGRTISLRFLGIVLRDFRLQVSLYNVYVKNQFQTSFARGWGGGGRGVKSVSRGDIEYQEENSQDFFSQLRPRTRPRHTEKYHNRVHFCRPALSILMSFFVNQYSLVCGVDYS